MSTHSYFGIQVTVAGTAKNLLTLLLAVDTLVPSSVRELSIQIDGGSSGAGPLLIGDANITTSRYGVELVKSTTNPPFKQYGSGSDLQSVPLANIYVLSGAGTVTINVEGFTG
jgi:hypothetical protein